MYFEIEDNINIISSKDVPVISSLYEVNKNYYY